MGLCPESWMGLMSASQGASGLAAGCGAPHLADVLTHIFNDHLISCDGFHGKQTPLVDPAPAESELLLPELEGRRQMLLDAPSTCPLASLQLSRAGGCSSHSPLRTLGDPMMLPFH